VWESEIVPMLEAAPGIRTVATFEEICRRDPGLAPGGRRILERPLEFKNVLEFRAWTKTDQCPDDIPAAPRYVQG